MRRVAPASCERSGLEAEPRQAGQRFKPAGAVGRDHAHIVGKHGMALVGEPGGERRLAHARAAEERGRPTARLHGVGVERE